MKTLLLDVCTSDEDIMILEDKLEVGTVDILFTPADVDNEEIKYPQAREKRKAVYVDTGFGREYIVTYKNQRRLISELFPVFGVYVFRGQTDKHMRDIVKELKEDRSLLDVFQ